MSQCSAITKKNDRCRYQASVGCGRYCKKHFKRLSSADQQLELDRSDLKNKLDDVRRKIVGVGRGTLEITGAVVLAKDLWDIIGPIFSLVLEEQQLELGRPDLKDKLGDVRRKIVDVGRGTLEIGGEVVLAKEIWDIFGPLLLLASEEQQLERDRSDLTNKLGDIRRKIVDVGHDTLEIEREVALAKELWEVFGPPLLLASELRYFGILLDPHIVDSREKLRAYKQLTYKLSMQPAMNTRVKSRRKST